MLTAELTPEQIARERAAVVAEAEGWLRTPFHHGARIKGVGVDCANLLVACYTMAHVTAPVLEDYPPDWFLHEDRPRFLPYLERACLPTSTPRAGDLALFRYGRVASHAAIVTGVDELVIHAFHELGVVLGSLAPTHDLHPRLVGFWTLKRWHRADPRANPPAEAE